MALPIPDLRTSLFDLSGRTSVVTGAAQGMGFAFSEGLASAGSAVVMVDMNAEEMDASGERTKCAVRIRPLPPALTNSTSRSIPSEVPCTRANRYSSGCTGG